jgi:hypothetical protein
MTKKQGRDGKEKLKLQRAESPMRLCDIQADEAGMHENKIFGGRDALDRPDSDVVVGGHRPVLGGSPLCARAALDRKMAHAVGRHFEQTHRHL